MAADDLELFDAVNRQTIAAGADTEGRAFVDALIAAGFDRRDMQVTFDETSVGLDVSSVQFAVLEGEDCLIGQYGSGDYRSELADQLGTGGCLLGETRPIDW